MFKNSMRIGFYVILVGLLCLTLTRLRLLGQNSKPQSVSPLVVASRVAVLRRDVDRHERTLQILFNRPGPPGPQGERGEVGPAGPAGPPGEPGVSPAEVAAFKRALAKIVELETRLKRLENKL